MKRCIPLEIFLSKCNAYEIGLKDDQPLPLSEEIIHILTFHCIRKWNSLPHFFLSNKHYSLLQLIQQITVFEEGCNLQKRELLDEAKLKNFDSLWHSCSYLLSDDMISLVELFNFRLIFLRFFNKLLKEGDQNNPSIYLNTHRSNEALIDIYNVAAFYGKNRPIQIR